MKIKSICVLLLLVNCQQILPPSPVGPLPSSQQMEWHKMEMNAFIHFSINTFTNREWGMGDESPKLFNPTAFNADQWISVLTETGFKGVILTCKHHDGFCLWPSAYTNHSVKMSPFQEGRGDIVKAVAEAAKKYHLNFGIYVSPWDRNHADYGRPAYIDYYRNQLKELFTQYGPMFEMWFDGANGGTGFYGGTNESRSIDGKTYYDWPTTIELIKGLEPTIIFFSDAGPGVRWVGNERGIAGETNWNTISADTLYAGKSGIENILNSGHEMGTQWIPAEVDVSIRPGWFYHPQEDSLVKTPQQLFDIYLTSVGRGSTLLLNVPPDRRGLLHEADVGSLRGFRKLIDSAFKNNLTKRAQIKATSFRGNDERYDPKNLLDGNENSYWATDDDQTTAGIEIQFSEVKEIKYLILQEYISLGQRVKAFDVEVWDGNAWVNVYKGTTIGYKRILKLLPVSTDKVKIVIKESKACPVILNLEIY